MIKRMITEISEEDFRKLDVKVYVTERVGNKIELVKKDLNDILDKEIKYCLESGYESDLKDLKIPVTIAIHEEPEPSDYERAHKLFPLMSGEEIEKFVRREFTYLDKFMNRFGGSQTFQIGWGIEHLYSKRDYYEAHGDYWRVSKKETYVIYRVKLSSKWLDKFVLKHKSEYKSWPYEELPEGVHDDFKVSLLKINYDLQEDGSWKEVSRSGIFKYDCSEHHVPVDINGKKI